jgi:hypothetical protein
MDGHFLFDTYCAPCHGTDGRGNGAVALALKTSPPDLSTLTANHGGTFPRLRVEQFVTDGTGGLGSAHGVRRMPTWGPMFWTLAPSDARTKDRIASVVAYVETIQSEVRIADGPLVHHRITANVFHMGALWMQVAPDTVFHKWLSGGAGKRATLALIADTPAPMDSRNTRVLTGALVHCTAPGKGFTAHAGMNVSVVLSIKQ